MKSYMIFILVAVTMMVPVQLEQVLASSIERGFVFAKTNCANCHAIGRYDESPLAIAPHFRTLHENYPVEALEEALAEGIVTGHPSMPEFTLDRAQINDLIAHLKSLE